MMKYLDPYLTGFWYCNSIFLIPNLQLSRLALLEREVAQGFEKLVPEASPRAALRLETPSIFNGCGLSIEYMLIAY